MERLNIRSSKVLEEAIEAFSILPGVGKRTAARYVLFLLEQDKEAVTRLSEAMVKLNEQIRYCEICGNLSDSNVCCICSSRNRDASLLCIVESIRDVMAIEATHQYKGMYHVLGGLISPIDGKGPEDINLMAALNRIATGNFREVIIALKSTVEGDTTGFYIFRKLQETDINISRIAKGIAIGDEIEYTDEVTLGRSILDRVPYEGIKI